MNRRWKKKILANGTTIFKCPSCSQSSYVELNFCPTCHLNMAEKRQKLVVNYRLKPLGVPRGKVKNALKFGGFYDRKGHN